MKQRIVIELEGEEPVIESMAEILRKTVTKEAISYDMVGLKGFSIFSKILPEEVPAEIQVPEFLNMEKIDQQVYDGNGVSQGEEVVQDG